ncbi:30S ribosomal protein S19e [Candidatus Pacearchaeota archaeon]|nr:30S ribosomal protein S19e [Candidatus Pacearchaeota archaeon]MBD3283645.1 30S ribosomal protein S19e [Candidatus Pacearchaeota archaeon]
MKTSIVYEMPADEYNKKLAETLKGMDEFKQPEWSFFVKSGTSKKRPPQDSDFWHKRAASILRQAYVRKIVGVNRLKTRYGSKKNRGFKPEKFRKSSGKIIRTILQQAEAAGLLEKTTDGKRYGRKLTKNGIELMEGVK